ncbi:MAG: nucleotide-binding protein [Candidatus Poribacteria bacterium]|nr:nucleotide-binding protein [Candidatus Poribacteria bacterium]
MNPTDGTLRSGCFFGKNFFICQTTDKTVKGILEEKGTWKVKLETAEGHPEYHPLACPWGSAHILEAKHDGNQKTLACKRCGGLWLAIIEKDSRLEYYPKSVTADFTEEGEIPILEGEQVNFVKDTYVDMMTEIQSQPSLVESRESARQKIKTQIARGYQLRHHEIHSEDELEKIVAECRNWSRCNKTLLLRLFTNSSVADAYSPFSYQKPFSSATNPLVNPSLEEQVSRYRERITNSINSLKGLYDELDLIPETTKIADAGSPAHIFGDKIFIVHGHDEAVKYKIAKFVTDLGLTVTILDEQPSKGQTIIDKFEEHADEAGFAIVLLTADDVGAPKDKAGELKPRARQNVILELGYFFRALGRERVCVFYEKGVEFPSDMHGILYVTMDNAGGWKLKLAKEMKIAGLPINPENLL